MSDTENNHALCLAVLPFENLSGNAEQDYFASGFVEDLITDLSHFNNLQVISSFTSRKMGGPSRNTINQAKGFSIDYLLKGNLRRKADQLRINAQLVETEGDRILWAERYDAPIENIFEIQDDIVDRVTGAISAQIDKALLAAARKKPLTSMAAYDCWLRGIDQLHKGTPQADRKARETFRQAITIDPHYSRAYAGISLSYFNEWSCQLWEHWEETERNAYKYAVKAIQLDDADHVTHLILGRILIYRRQFESAQQHVDQSLALNANDADNLVLAATCRTFLGEAEKGEELFLKAMRLNPYRNMWYYTAGAFTYFGQREFEKCIETALKGPLTSVWVDLPAFVAAAHAHLGNATQAAHYLNIFEKEFRKKIITDHDPSPEEIITWEKMANPFKRKEDESLLVDGLVLAGLDYSSDPKEESSVRPGPVSASAAPNVFTHDNGLWQMTYEDKSVQISGVKGFHDLARLMVTPGVEVHCTEIMGVADSMSEDDSVLDDRAMASYEQRIRDLWEEIREAESMHDIGRAEKLNAEMDQLTEHITKAMGIGRRPRKLKAPAERARAAVTWRIRSAIKKIEDAHPSLGHHLSNAIRTGTFCCYDPEKEMAWHL